MARFLVTGGAGFIGSNLVGSLLTQGHEVRVVDDLATGRRENLLSWQGHFEWVEASLLDSALLTQAARGVDYILHQAALGSVPRSIENPLGSTEVNVIGTLNVLIAARDAGVKRVVYASSSSVYGDTPTLPKVETMLPTPKSPYAASKLAGEHYCRAFYDVYGLETVVLRYFNVFGPRQNPNSPYAAVIPKFIKAMASGQRPVIFGDGSNSRDFTFVANNVLANTLAATTSGRAVGEVMNIACGNRYSLLDLVTSLNRILGTNLEPEFRPSRTGDVEHSLADIGKARELIGYEPKIAFYEGLQQTATWMLEREELQV